MVKLYTESFERKYHARVFSCTNLFYVLTVISVWVIPLVIIALTGSFTGIPSVNYSRSNVKFTNEVYIQGDFGGTIRSYSNIQLLNQQINNKISGVIFKSRFRDENNDRIPEEYKFDLSFLTNAESVNSLTILLHFKYYIENGVNSQFKGIVPIIISSPSGKSIGEASMVGELRIRQDEPIEKLNGIPETLYNLNFTEEILKYSPEQIIDRYTSRNQTLNYVHTARVNSFNKISLLDTTTISIEMGIPNFAKTLYTPGALETLKIAWIQYFAILVPIYLLLYIGLFARTIETYVFDSVMTNDCQSSIRHKLKKS
ncbi:unnamed protein product [Moneuplotes crassus]|uniref:Transmembrane protein 231 n=1 Tax=Euplotes crassus TaxID=5936 RepID=A0AAD2D1E4_EUPCR|nr:unnamed protein product [Moneuplotes crassus]